MWRTRAVLSLLYEDVAGLPREEEATAERRAETMSRARRRALIAVAIDWAAIVVLVLVGDGTAPMLTLGPAERAVFTVAILVVAVHSGFRLGQIEKLRAVARAGDRLAASDPES